MSVKISSIFTQMIQLYSVRSNPLMTLMPLQQAWQRPGEDGNLGRQVEGNIWTIEVQGYDNIQEKSSHQAWTQVWKHTTGRDERAGDSGSHNRQQTDLDKTYLLHCIKRYTQITHGRRSIVGWKSIARLAGRREMSRVLIGGRKALRHKNNMVPTLARRFPVGCFCTHTICRPINALALIYLSRHIWVNARHFAQITTRPKNNNSPKIASRPKNNNSPKR